MVSLAITLEDVAAQTYTRYVSDVSTASLRALFGSVAPVEAQHRSVLLAVQALLNAGDLADVAHLALQLENQAAQTYLFAAGNVSSVGGIATAASIAPVEAMHAAILHFVLGEYPVPASFLGAAMAASPPC